VKAATELTQYNKTANRIFPFCYVVREWHISAGVAAPVPQPKHELCSTLELARAAIPGGSARLNRDKHDDPAIIEVWV
jgi:hypothetical protein